MGGCCSKSTAATTMPLAPNDHESDLKSLPPPPPQHEKKKEIFVIKHRISHDDGTNATFNTTTTTSVYKEEEFDDDNQILQCGSGSGSGSRLSRSNSTTRLDNPSRKRSCRSNLSVDFDLNTRFDNLYYHHDVDDEHRAGRARGVSATRNGSSRSSSKERRISISPSRTTRRRSESPFRNLNTSIAGNSNPVKMVSVPATNKSCNFQEEVCVKRIHVKRNVSPAKARPTDLRVFTDQHHTDTREVDRLYYTRKSLVEIDNNSATSNQPGKRTRKLSRDMNLETQFDPSPGPPSYASLLLEDIHKFHQNNPNAATAASPAFVLPECVTKACSIMEAVSDLNSNTSSLCSEDRYKNLTMIEHQIKKDKPIESGTVVNGVSASAVGDQPHSQTELTSHNFKVRGLGGFKKDFMDYPSKGTTHGRRSAYSLPKTTTAALT
uniref:uncharacterized protein At1g65710-like n=1 Tax=Erigeron canadensis TaxID=72917 RepID=UPI001CB8EC55|nr:uncharacterized protein At1g65710-like [Erigeron canadensis]